MAAPPALHLGTQGWSYPDWVGTFYPPSSRQQDWLPFYARVFDAVELDATFYHPPRPSIVRSWAAHTPPGFRFAAKVPQRITHESRLVRMGEHLAAFWAALAPLGERAGPLLVQMPAAFERDPGTVGVVERFLAAAPRGAPRAGPRPAARLALEFRHRSWQHEATWELLRRHGAAAVWSEWRDLPRIAAVTADFLYLRWLGRREEIVAYDRVQIDRDASFEAWRAELERALPRVREVYGFFNNHWAGHSPASANEMKRRLGLPAVDPKTLWPQGELF